MPTPQPGEVWVDQSPMTDRREWRDRTKYRRVVTVTTFDSDGFVEGASSWLTKTRTGWIAMDYPPARTTRIRADVFVRRFIRAEES